MRDGARAFFRYEAFFTILEHFKTEILHIYSVTGQILKYLFPLVSLPSEKYSLRGSVEYILLLTSTLGNNCLLCPVFSNFYSRETL